MAVKEKCQVIVGRTLSVGREEGPNASLQDREKDRVTLHAGLSSLCHTRQGKKMLLRRYDVFPLKILLRECRKRAAIFHIFAFPRAFSSQDGFINTRDSSKRPVFCTKIFFL